MVLQVLCTYLRACVLAQIHVAHTRMHACTHAYVPFMRVRWMQAMQEACRRGAECWPRQLREGRGKWRRGEGREGKGLLRRCWTC